MPSHHGRAAAAAGAPPQRRPRPGGEVCPSPPPARLRRRGRAASSAWAGCAAACLLAAGCRAAAPPQPTATAELTATLTDSETFTLPTASSGVTVTLPSATATLSQTVTLRTATQTQSDTMPTATATQTAFYGSCADVRCGIARGGADGEWNWASAHARCDKPFCTPADCCNRDDTLSDRDQTIVALAPRYSLHRTCDNSTFQSTRFNVTVSSEAGCRRDCTLEPGCFGIHWIPRVPGGGTGTCILADVPFAACSAAVGFDDCDFEPASSDLSKTCLYQRRAILPWYAQFTDTLLAARPQFPLDDEVGSCGAGALLLQPMLNATPAACVAACDQMNAAPGGKAPCVAVTWRTLPVPSPKRLRPGAVLLERDFAYSECQLWATLRCPVPNGTCLGAQEARCEPDGGGTGANSSANVTLLPAELAGSLIDSFGACPHGGPCMYVVRSARRTCEVTMLEYILYWGPLACIILLVFLCLSSTCWLCWNMRSSAGPDGKKKARPCCMLFVMSIPVCVLMIIPWALEPEIRETMVEECPSITEPLWGANLAVSTPVLIEARAGVLDEDAPVAATPTGSPTVGPTRSPSAAPTHSPTAGAQPTASPALTAAPAAPAGPEALWTPRSTGTVVVEYNRPDPALKCTEIPVQGRFWGADDVCFSPEDWGTWRLPQHLSQLVVVPGQPQLGRYDFRAVCVDGAEVSSDGKDPQALVQQYTSKDGSCSRLAWSILAPAVSKLEDIPHGHCVRSAVPNSTREEAVLDEDFEILFQCSKCRWILWANVMNAPLHIMLINSICSLVASGLIFAVHSYLCNAKKEDDEQSDGYFHIFRGLLIGACPFCSCETVDDSADFEKLDHGETIYMRDLNTQLDSDSGFADASEGGEEGSEDSEHEAVVEQKGTGRSWVNLRFKGQLPKSWRGKHTPSGSRVHVDGLWWEINAGRRGHLSVTKHRKLTAQELRSQARDNFEEKYDAILDYNRELMLKYDSISEYVGANAAPPLPFVLLKTVFLIGFFIIGVLEVRTNAADGITGWARYSILYIRQVNSGTPLLLVEAFRGALGSLGELKSLEGSEDADEVAEVRSRTMKNCAATLVAMLFFLPPTVTHIIPMMFAFPWLCLVLYIFGFQLCMQVPSFFFESIAADWKGMALRSPLKARALSVIYGVTIKFTSSFLIGLPFQMFYNYGVQLYAGMPYWQIPLREWRSRDWDCFFEQGLSGQSLAGFLQFISFWF